MLVLAVMLLATPPASPFSEVEALIASFRGGRVPSERVQLEPSNRELLDPAAFLPRSQDFDRASLAALARWVSTCREEPVADPRLAKAVTMQRALCGGPALPADFFAQAPWMHPLGGSFAARGQGPVEAHHVLERPETLLGRLGPDALAVLVAGSSIVLGPRDVLIREPGLVSSAYAAYPRAAWDAHVAAQSFVLGASDAECALRSGPYCWRRTEKSLLPALGIAALALALILAAATLVSRWRAHRRAAEERRFILQTLTHELRTPATALTLALEPLRNDFDRLSDPGQTAFLRLCDEVQRLHRMVDGSRRYLEGEAKLELRRVDSVNALLEDLLEPVRGRIELKLLAADVGTSTDPNWLGVCLRNLVDNALEHGAPPVQVWAEHQAGHLHVDVRDGGRLPADFVVRPWVKGEGSAGLGLGLSIAQHLALRLGGRLTWTQQPTAFRLELPGSS